MTERDDSEPAAGAGIQPAVAAVLAEVERVIGAEEFGTPRAEFQWILPVASPDELLAILRGAPGGVGLAGLEAYLRERLGTLSGLKAVGDPEVEA